MTGSQKGVTSAVKRLEKALGELVVSSPDGAYLGSETDLIARYATTRATFRQAARLAEHQQLLVIRRGPGGGFFGRRPDVDSVAKSAATYLRLKNTRLVDVVRGSRALGMDAARLAAQSLDQGKRERLADIAAALEEAADQPLSADQFIRLERSLIDAILDLAENTTIELFFKVSYRFGWSESTSRVFDGRQDRVDDARRARLKLARAILDNDVEVSALLFDRQCSMFIEWMIASE